MYIEKMINSFGKFISLMIPIMTILIGMSWRIKEVSTEAGGLNYVYLQKTLIILFPMTLLLTYLYQLLSGKWK